MAKYSIDDLVPIVKPSKSKESSTGTQAGTEVEVWGQGGVPQKQSDQGQTQPQSKKQKKAEGKGKSSKEGKKAPAQSSQPQENLKPLTDTEKITEKYAPDGTTKAAVEEIYKEAKRRVSKMSGAAGAEAGSLMSVIEPLVKAKVQWKRLLKDKVRFFVDKIGSQLRKSKSYLMYPWKAQSQVGIISPGPLHVPKEGYIYMIFAFDTSGSISQEELEHITTELNDVASILIKGKYNLKGKVFALEWDTKVHQFIEYKPSKSVKVYGGGGTEPKCIFDYIDKKIEKEVGENKYLLSLTPQDKYVVRKFVGSKYTNAPLLVIFTDGQFFGQLTKSDLGKIYGISENNIIYILTTDDASKVYPKNPKNIIFYDRIKF